MFLIDFSSLFTIIKVKLIIRNFTMCFYDGNEKILEVMISHLYLGTLEWLGMSSATDLVILC